MPGPAPEQHACEPAGVEQWTAILGSLADAYLVVDPSGAVEWANAAAGRLLAADPAQLRGALASRWLGAPLAAAADLQVTATAISEGRQVLCLRPAAGGANPGRRAMGAIVRASTQLSTYRSVEQVLQSAVTTLPADLGAHSAQVWLADSPEQPLSPRARGGRAREGTGFAEPAAVPPGPIARVAADKLPLLVPRLEDHGDFDLAWARAQRVVSAALFPLPCQELPTGVLALFFGGKLEPEVLETASTIAAMLSGALQALAVAERERQALAESESTSRRLEQERVTALASASELAAANQALRRKHDELEMAKHRLSAQYSVLEILAQSPSVEHAAPRVLAAIGESMGWDAGALFLAMPRSLELKAYGTWTRRADAAEYLERTRIAAYASGVGIVGRVWQTGEPAWSDDAPRMPGFRRAQGAVAAGLRGAIWVPLRQGSEVVGVVELLRRDLQGPDEETLQGLLALGSQIGQFAERLRAEAALREGEERLKITLRSIVDAVITTDLHGRIDFMNEVACELTGVRLDQARRRPVEEVYRPVDERTRAPLSGVVQKVLASGRTSGLSRQALLARADGENLVVEHTAAPLRGERGELLGTVLVFRDVTERERASRRARFSAEASAMLAHSLDYHATLADIARLAALTVADVCAVYLLEPERLTRVALNCLDEQQCQSIAAYLEAWPPRLTDPRGAGAAMRTGQTELCERLDQQALAELAPSQPQRDQLQQLGLRSLVAVPLRARDATLGALLLACRDRRLLADDLLAAEELAGRAGLAIDNSRLFAQTQRALRGRDEFLSVASHELKTPITSMQLQLQSLLRSEEALSERARAKLTIATRQVARMASLIEEMLQVSRVNSGAVELDLEPLELAALADEICQRFTEPAERAGCALRLRVDGDSWGMWDRARLRIVLSNLLSNAIKYGPGKPVDVEVVAGGDAVSLAVVDHGIGIADADLTRLFDCFERAVSPRHYGGLGVGLFIVRSLVEMMGGTVEASSTPGEGARFAARLPRVRSTATSSDCSDASL